MILSLIATISANVRVVRHWKRGGESVINADEKDAKKLIGETVKRNKVHAQQLTKTDP